MSELNAPVFLDVLDPALDLLQEQVVAAGSNSQISEQFQCHEGKPGTYTSSASFFTEGNVRRVYRSSEVNASKSESKTKEGQPIKQHHWHAGLRQAAHPCARD